jgi:hypothetical protein
MSDINEFKPITDNYIPFVDEYIIRIDFPDGKPQLYSSGTANYHYQDFPNFLMKELQNIRKIYGTVITHFQYESPLRHRVINKIKIER